MANGQLLAWNGPKNYIANSSFENQLTTGYSLGTTGTLTNGIPTGSPTFGSGTTSLAISIVTSGQLAGLASLAYTASATTTAGNMLASDPLAIDIEDQAKVLTYSFSYKAQSNPGNANWSGTSSNSFGVAAWDATNSVWLPTSKPFGMIQSSLVGNCSGTFQTGATTASIRLVVYNANATSGAITLYFDDIFVGPQAVSNISGLVISQAKATGAISTTNGGIVVLPSVNFDTTASYNASTGVYTCPSSGFYEIKSTGISNNGAVIGLIVNKNGAYAGNLCGNSSNSNVNTDSGVLTVQCNAGDALTVVATGTGGLQWTSGQIVATFTFQLIQSSGVGPAGQVVAASYFCSANQSVSTTQPINFDSKIFDTNASVTTGSAWKYTASVSGFYSVGGFWNATAGFTGQWRIYKNGTYFQSMASTNSTVAENIASAVVQLNAGDFIDFRLSTAQTVAGGILGADNTGYVTIALLQGPTSSQQAAPSVNARYFASATTISASLATIVWTTKDFDSNAGMASGVYTIPITGKYQINSAVATTGTFSLNNQVIIEIQKNGTVVSRDKNFAGGIVTDLTAAISDIISCNANDTVRIQLSSSATGPTIVSSNFENYFSISLVGQ